MHIGLHYRGTDLSMSMVDLARAAEERGFTSVFIPEHTHVPAKPPATRPALGDGERREVDTSLRAVYQRVWDPYVGLAFAAASSTLTVGTCIALVAQHDPIALAKTVASLDVMSGGRFVFGVGTGWDDQEFEDHGHPRGERLAVFREHLRVMRTIWGSEVAEFAGAYTRMGPSYSWPKPTASLEVLLGCRPRRRGFDLLTELCDGWIPQDFAPAATLDRDLRTLHAAWEAAGRSGRPTVVVMQELSGVRAALDVYQRLDVAHVLLDVPTLPGPELTALLDRLADAVRGWLSG